MFDTLLFCAIKRCLKLELEETMEFNKLGIIEPVLRALEDEGYETPTPIQTKTITPALEGKDIVGLAQTGTGKTAAFAIPTLQLLAQNLQSGRNRSIRALVLTPTRELGIQVHESFANYGHYLPLRSTVVFGGTSQGKQVKALRSGIDILVATPGRLIDLINQGYIDLSKIEILILDEADRMLDMGFIHDIRRIVKLIPAYRQTLLFSATMPKEITQIVKTLLVDPVEVSVAPVSSTVDTVEQFIQYVDRNHKMDLFMDFLSHNRGEPVLMFTRTKRGADIVVRELKKRGVDAVSIHGDKSQAARQRALKDFKEYKTQILVATDIAARGIDIEDLSYVVNYDIPEDPETYVHRIGRTGRAGNTGRSISYVSHQEIPLLKEIEKLIKKKIDVVENKKYPLVDKTEKKKPGRKPSINKKGQRDKTKSSSPKKAPGKKRTDSTTKNKTVNTKDGSQRFKKSKPERRNKAKVRGKYNAPKGKK